MIGGRRQSLLALTLIVGVLCMHALVLIDAAPAAGEQVQPPVAAAHAVPAHAPAGPHTTAVTAAVMHGPDVAGHGSMPSSHQVMHLCMAILAAMVVLGAVVLALWRTVRADCQGLSTAALVRRAPLRRPPPTSVRLAQLSVLRT